MDTTDRIGVGRATRSAVVVNPAKVDNLSELRRTVRMALSRAGWPVPRWFETTPEDPGRGQAREAVQAGAEVVFVCGGDGTVASVASALVGTDTAMAVLPAGTGNLLAANLGLSTDLAAGLEVALEGGLRRLDVGASHGQFFTVMAGMGFDAHMLAATSETAKARIGWPAYVLGAIRHLRDRPMRVSIRIDDGEPMRRHARSVLIANVGRLPGGVRLLTEAQPDDGLLDIAILTPRSLRQWAALALAVIRRSTPAAGHGGPSCRPDRRAQQWTTAETTRWRPHRPGTSADRGSRPQRVVAVRATARRTPGSGEGRRCGSRSGSQADREDRLSSTSVPAFVCRGGAGPVTTVLIRSTRHRRRPPAPSPHRRNTRPRPAPRPPSRNTCPPSVRPSRWRRYRNIRPPTRAERTPPRDRRRTPG